MAAAPKGASPATAPPPLSAPPPVPVSGVPRVLQAKAPELTEAPKGQRPEQAFAERSRAAIAKATGEGQKAQDAAAGEDAAPPPKAKADGSEKDSPKSSTSAPKDSASSSAAEKSPPSDSSEVPAGGKTAEPAPLDMRTILKWCTENPEDGATLRTKLGLPPDSNSEWIRLKNRERKVKENIRGEHEKTMAEAKAERQAAEEARQAIDGAATKLGPIADLWEAVAEPVRNNPQNPQLDFEAADAAFHENTGISIDDYMRRRARRTIGSSSDAVKLRVENQKLKRELAGKPSDALKPPAEASTTSKGEAGDGEASATTKPKKGEKDWSDELPGKHKFRQLDGWNALLDTEMRKHYDPDTQDYDADPEQIADKLLKREIARMSEEEVPEEPASRARPKAKPPAAKPKDGVPSAAELTPRKRPEPKTPAADAGEDDDVKVAGMTWAQRQKRAIDRAMARARGEIE